MAYDLSYFSKTYNTTFKANKSSASIQSRYPYVCSRPALKQALVSAQNSWRNFKGLTLDELTDTIIEYFDLFMYDHWSGNVYTPTAFESAVNSGYRWDQTEFWNQTAIIFHSGGGGGVGRYVLDNVDIVLLPGNGFTVITKEYKDKPFLGFDYRETKSTFAAELDLTGSVVTDLTNSLVDAGSFVIGETYTIREVGDTDWIAIGATNGTFDEQFTATGAGSGTGKARETAGTITDHQDNPTGLLPSFMYVYDYQYYHSTLTPHGHKTDYWYGSTPTNWNNFTTSDIWFNKSTAKFGTVVDSEGKIQSIYAISRDDGDGNPVTGGWGYNSSHQLKKLSWFLDENGDGIETSLFEGYDSARGVYVKAPTVLIDTTTDQSGYTGNKAEIDIANTFTDYYAGKNLPVGETLYAYAIYGDNQPTAYAIDPPALPDYQYSYNRSWPYYGVQPMSVRVVDERPAITATTRSLNTHTVGTGAQRYSFEFDYPPMTYEEAREMITTFEKGKGPAEKIRIGIPSTAMKHIQGVFYKAPLYKASNTIKVTGGTTGATDVVLSGLEPNSREIKEGTYFAHIYGSKQKIHQIVEAENTDDWGRQNVRIYPPLRAPLYNLPGRTTEGTHSGIWFLIEAYIVDDSFEYTVDAAGLYRLSCRFIEALD